MVVIISSCRSCLVIRYAVTSAPQSSRVLSVELRLQWVTGGGVSRAKQFLRIGTWLFTVAAEESVGIGFHRVAFGRDRALAFTRAAVPGGRSKAFHGSLLLSCSARAGLVRLAVLRLRGSAA